MTTMTLKELEATLRAGVERALPISIDEDMAPAVIEFGSSVALVAYRFGVKHGREMERAEVARREAAAVRFRERLRRIGGDPGTPEHENSSSEPEPGAGLEPV